MNKNKLLLVGTCILAGLAVAARLGQFFVINDQGVTSSVMYDVLAYAPLLLVGVFVFSCVRSRDFDSVESFLSKRDYSAFFMIIGAMSIFEACYWTICINNSQFHLAIIISSFLFGLLLIVGFMISHKFPNISGTIISLAVLAFYAEYILSILETFTNSRTSLTTTINCYTVVALCMVMFLGKALLRDLVTGHTEKSRASMVRTSIVLAVVLPADIATKLLYNMNKLDFLPQSVMPARYDISCIAIDLMFVAFVFYILANVYKCNVNKAK